MANTTVQLTAAELATAYAAGELSPVEVTRDALGAIDRTNPACNAYSLVDYNSAVAQAKAAERRWRMGAALSRLDGVPMSIKDMFPTRGWPTLRGSTCIRPKPGDMDAPVPARLRASGAVFLGSTTTPELAWKATTDSPLTGITRNPWDIRKTPGGSSGGSAAAVAAGFGPLSVGTDGGGSIRIPASFCGIVGYKPTYGRIPLYPASPFGALAHAGPMARSVEDVALLLDVLAVPDRRDPTALPVPSEPYEQASGRDCRTVAIAFSPTLGYAAVDAEVGEIVADAVSELSGAGMRIEQSDPGFADPVDAFEVLWATGAAKWLETFPAGSSERVDPGLRRVWERGLRYTAMDYLEATSRRSALAIHMAQFHAKYDLLITPTMPIKPFAAGYDVPPDSDCSRWPEWTQFSYPFNMTQQPAISIPVGFTRDRLPVGLQIVGRPREDDLVLAAARLAERVLGWPSSRLATPVARTVAARQQAVAEARHR